MEIKRTQDYYSNLWGDYAVGSDEKFRMRRILKMLNVWTKDRISAESECLKLIDLGCGNGWLSSYLIPYGAVDAADFDATTLNRSQMLYEDVNFYLLDESNDLYGMSDGSYDVVVASEVLEHVSDKNNFMNIVWRVLKPSGLLILTTPRGEFFESWARFVNYDLQPIEVWIGFRELETLLRKEGFEVCVHETLFFTRYDNTLFQRIFCSFPFLLLRKISWLWEKLFDRFGIYQIVVARKLDR